jgi:thiol:disulfide interchange protein
MNATLTTRQIRLVAILVLVVVVVGGYLVVSKGKSNTDAATSTPALTTHATTTPTPTKTDVHSAAAVAAAHGLPRSVAHALQMHSVVVVSLTAPRGEDDQVTQSEAQAGAAESKVGYVHIDVFHQQPGTAILRKLGVVDTPEVLIIRRPGVIISQFKGFVDRDVVAQAAAEAH